MHNILHVKLVQIICNDKRCQSCTCILYNGFVIIPRPRTACGRDTVVIVLVSLFVCLFVCLLVNTFFRFS